MRPETKVRLLNTDSNQKGALDSREPLSVAFLI